MLEKFLSRASGVIHVGANYGQERHVYDQYGLNVVWIEALPDVYRQLVGNIADLPKQSAVQALVTDVVGQTYKFNIANNEGASSSILDFAEHKDIWPTVEYVGQMDLVSTTLDKLAADGLLRNDVMDFMVLDTQGSELMALKGAETVLKGIRFLMVEAANFESYKGCTTSDELAKWLQTKGFCLVAKSIFAEHPAGGNYFDLFFERAVDDKMLLRVADELNALAHAFDAIGLNEAGSQIACAASAVDGSFPEPAGWWSAPFNQQAGRTELILKLLERLRPKAILETGTFRGTTTRFLAERFPGPIYTCELDQRWYLTALRNCKDFPSIVIERGDSRGFLERRLATTEGPLFIYLDAHWGADLPLAEELLLVFSSGKDAVIVIDDFEVPDDAGYSFDDYGPGKRLTSELLATVNPKDAALFFPTLSSSQETGAKRGCAVISTGSTTAVLAQVDDLRQFPWPSAETPATPARFASPAIEDSTAAIRHLSESADLRRAHANLLLEHEALLLEHEALQKKVESIPFRDAIFRVAASLERKRLRRAKRV